MRRSGNRASLAGQPALIGAVTILVVAVATYLAYGANDGLPFAPAYRIVVNAPDAGHLYKDADVRMAGIRVGRLAAAVPVPHADGHATVRLNLTLVKDAARLPVDTRFVIQPRSYAGAEYVNVLRGHAKATIPDGGVVALRRFRRSVSLQDSLSAYTAPVRRGMREQLRGFSYGLAGRGRGLNGALGQLDRLLGHLGPAARLLRAPDTHLPRLVRGLSRVSGEVAPVAREQARGFAELHATYAALSRSPQALRDLIVASPPAEAAVVRDARDIEAYLQSSTRLSKALAPAARELPRASRALAAAFAAGTRGYPATRRTLPRAEALARGVGDFATAAPVIPAVERLTLLGSTLRPLVSVLAPAETRCRYASLLFRNLASALKEGPSTGAALRVVLVALTSASNSEAGLASAPSANPDGVALGALHANPYPSAAGPGQPRSCQAGQERYRPGRIDIGNPRPVADAVTESPKGR